MDFKYKFLTDIRKSSGFSAKEVAETIGVHKNSVHNAEHGRFSPSFKLVLQLLKLYGYKMVIVEAKHIEELKKTITTDLIVIDEI